LVPPLKKKGWTQGELIQRMRVVINVLLESQLAEDVMVVADPKEEEEEGAGRFCSRD
jgi:hypothetical protein